MRGPVVIAGVGSGVIPPVIVLCLILVVAILAIAYAGAGLAR